MKKRTANPWMSATDYGHSLPAFTINLLVRDVAAGVEFYEAVLGGTEHYKDEDFAALNVAGLEFMLHADHTYETHPWVAPLEAGERRGLGVELRLLGLDPDKVETLARQNDAVLIAPATDKPHGWRETMVQDPDGYIWAVGIKIN
ncbi:MAG: VOC family protein [Chloroflexota bacterium]|nr:VOC family protein [Chloroflexota bacterium]